MATSERPKKKSFLRELPGIVITALVISVLIKTFLVQAFYIPSGSMENTLLVNDRVLVNKLADKPDEIHRGDVVVFRDPGGWLGAASDTGRGGVIGGLRNGTRLRRSRAGRRRGRPHQAGHRLSAATRCSAARTDT